MSLALGFVLLALGGLSSGSGAWLDSLRYTLTSVPGLVNAGALFLLIVLPASLPATLAGGWLAARAFGRVGIQPLTKWLAGGAARGFGLGATGCALWFGGINAADGLSRDVLVFVGFMALIGGVAGSVIGAVVGAYCWSLSRQPRSAAGLRST
jgi:hypothetical protein